MNIFHKINPSPGEAQETRSSHWRYGLIAALLMTLLASWPQFDLWSLRGSEYQGAYAYAQYDEDIYAAYLNGVVAGRPLRSDPLIELQDGQPPPESLFSIQSFPPLLLAAIAKITGLSTRMIFILLPPALAFLATLVLYYLLAFFINDKRMAFCGSLFILCFGTLAGRDGFVIHLLGWETMYRGLPFLRRYQPGLSFPLFFVFALFTWQAVNRRDRRGWLASVAAGFVFALLVFSYFYLWTAAAAWFFVFVVLWLYAHRSDWRELLWRLSPVVIISGVTLIVYALMLSKIERTTSSITLLDLTRMPDLLRGPEVIGAVVLTLLFLAVKKKLAQWSDPLVLLILSFALSLFLPFNQQILTGRSLQPYHYEVLIGNYVALLALALTFAIFRRGAAAEKSLIPQRAFFWLCVLSLVWGELEIGFNTLLHRQGNPGRDAFVPVARRLNELAVTSRNRGDNREVLFSPDILTVADNTAGYTPHALLWATHAVLTPALNEQQRQERFFKYLYYSEVTSEELKRRLREEHFRETCALFGYGRYVSYLTVNFNPVSAAEIEEKVSQYSSFVATFDHRRASIPTLSWVVIPDGSAIKLTNLDRWYVRETEERIGAYRLFHVRLHDTTAKDGADHTQ
ncbi:MAG: hypothetical protein AB7U82_16600 [Blastocatellales bacterium]